MVLHALGGLTQGRNLPDALAQAGLARLNPRERAFAGRLAQHAVRHRRRLQLDMAAYLKRPSRDAEVNNLLWLGAAQIEVEDIPDHAAVDSTVSLAPQRKRGLINAILRRRLREPPAQRQDWGELLSFPDWLISAIKRDWREQTPAILAALNEEPAQCLRINRRQLSRTAWLQQLDAELRSSPLGEAASQQDGVVLGSHQAMTSLPGYAQGQVAAQGASAQAAASLMVLEPGLSVLDACSAPGGKTAHMLELEPQLNCLALDVDEMRLERVKDNLQRLGHLAQLQHQDVLSAAFDAGRFDRILLDVPCSGTGVIARHPDIKWLRRESDLNELAGRQLAMLKQVWPWLKPGGRVLYCTCSILSVENDAVIAAFLAEHTDARHETLNLPFGQASEYGWRVPPLRPYEGFYFSRLIKA